MIVIDDKYLQDKSSDRSSSSDCVLTIHHTCKHKKVHKHRTTATTSFDNPVPHLLISSSPPNASKTEQLPFKLLASSANATKYSIENPSSQKSLSQTTLSSSEEAHGINEVVREQQSIEDHDQSASLHENRPHKNVTRINHYPNMLADFD